MLNHSQAFTCLELQALWRLCVDRWVVFVDIQAVVCRYSTAEMKRKTNHAYVLGRNKHLVHLDDVEAGKQLLKR
ncbi:hypothetical protein M758_11G095700 [Ceratodon purpureus]|uniref:Uncharacterized protein n=1 Tax=Ceratodon purpureus TaxID=3225 RepID=A0A8T0GFF3_CERPU|nr:hypothetical protein KC19_11G098500 [Ceratodon purpureus]KAG0601239.1 hypothetical protein M758_11G095700 [Ceratodon purpureus]